MKRICLMIFAVCLITVYSAPVGAETNAGLDLYVGFYGGKETELSKETQPAGTRPEGETSPSGESQSAGTPPEGETLPSGESQPAGAPPEGETLPSGESQPAGAPPEGETLPSGESQPAGAPSEGETLPSGESQPAGAPPEGETSPSGETHPAGVPSGEETAPSKETGPDKTIASGEASFGEILPDGEIKEQSAAETIPERETKEQSPAETLPEGETKGQSDAETLVEGEKEYSGAVESSSAETETDTGILPSDAAELTEERKQREDEAVISLKVPATIDFWLDQYGLKRGTQIHSQEYIIQNNGSTSIEVSFIDIRCIVADDIDPVGEDWTEEEVRNSDDQVIKLVIYMDNGDEIAVTEHASSYELLLGPGERAGFRISGAMSGNIYNRWKTGDVSIEIIYGADVYVDALSETESEAAQD